MTIATRCALATSVALALTLTGCASSQHSESTTFPLNGTHLDVTNPNDNMRVTVRGTSRTDVSVTVATTTALKTPTTPDWSLNGDQLDLDSPCTKGYIGLCEGSYTLTVPTGTTVTINGAETTVR